MQAPRFSTRPARLIDHNIRSKQNEAGLTKTGKIATPIEISDIPTIEIG
jgi:hypothetical protein